MANVIQNVSKVHIPDDQNLFLLAMKRYKSWFLINNPWHIPMITAAYLIFVLKIGPDLMKNRKPLNVKYFLLIYNLYQTLYNGYLFSHIFTVEGGFDHIVTYACHPMERAINPFCFLVSELSWHYVFSKVIDLLDTIFFVLRKKQSHVTFLHIYHHTNMVMSVWYFSYNFDGEQIFIIGIVNTFVHTIMYAYYFLSALGPGVRKYLWWKVYVTRLQMMQFAFIIIYMSCLLMFRCALPEGLSLYIIIQGCIFFALFSNFYIKSYYFPPKTKELSTNGKVLSGVKKFKVM